MLSVIVPRFKWNILSITWPMHIRFGVHQLTVIIGFFLIMLSYGLMRGKRHAWHLAIALLLLSTILHILHGGSVLAMLVVALPVFLLAALAGSFQAKSDPPSAVRGYTSLLLGLGIVTFYTIGGFLALYGEFEPLIDRFGIENVLLRLITHTHLHLPPGTQAFFFERALPVLCLSAVLYGMVSIFRPVAATLLPDEQERIQVSLLTRRYGASSISYFAQSEEKLYFFSASGKAFISYALAGSVAVVAGDPIGPREEMLPVLQEFITFCHQQDWTVVFWQVRDEWLAMYRSVGLRMLKIGEDAVINTYDFTLKGGAMANVRTSAKRAEKEGIHVVLYRGTVTDTEQLARLESISRAWLAQKGSSEMGFSMGRFDPQGDAEQIYALALDKMNNVQAFITFVPIYGRHGWGLDLMRRAEKCAPGIMELLLVSAIEYLKKEGAEMLSLGLATLSNSNQDEEGFLDNSVGYLSHHFGDPGKQQSLFNFKKKFQPVWESRYLVYSSTLSLPKIGLALYRVHLHDGSSLMALRRGLRAWRQQVRTRQEQLMRRTDSLESLHV